MTEKIRFGIIGCGVIGPTHAKAISGIPDARLVAVADVVAEKAQKLAETYGATPYANVREMLDRERLDVVDICTPSGLHGELACQAMRTGRHIIVEKPMEIKREAIAQMLRVQRESGVKMAVISQHRFDAASKHVYELAQQHAFGRLVLGQAQIPWWRSQQYYDSGAWRGTWELDGGGVLMNQGIHSIDLLQWLMGPVRTVYAHTDTLAHHMETEDVAVAVLRFANGALGTLAATTGAYPGLGTRIELFGDQGSAVIADDRLAALHLRTAGEDVSPYGLSVAQRAEAEGGQAAVPSAASDPAAIGIASHREQIADMVQAIRDDRPPLVDGEAGRRPVEIILGVYESARTHQEVTLP
jgi:UDP-N-acetyl-2-amino-2-deoxyglucuronate dehydrogenase